ncbi:MAG: CDP-glycerol glycerophosphotransferase family protein [Zhenhengia sp.]
MGKDSKGDEEVKDKFKQIIKVMIGLLPVTNKIIFESSPDFADNTRAVFEYMVVNKLNDKYKMIWLVNKPNDFKHVDVANTIFCPMYPKNIVEQIQRVWHIATAKYIIVCNRGIAKYNNKTKSINLWHGSGLKACKELKLVLDCCDDVLTSSEFYKPIFAKELQVEYKKLRCLGYPRNDWMFVESDDLERLNIALKDEKVIMWMPTFRQHKNGKRFDVTVESALGLPIIEDESMLEELNRQLEVYKLRLIIKIHPAQDLSFIKVENLSHICLLTNQDIEEKGVNLYKIVGRCDALITDYSSIYVDYMMLDRPMAFTLDDLEDYRANKGFVFENPLSYMPGNHLYTFEDMKCFIEELAKGQDRWQEERRSTNNLFNQYHDGQSCKRFCEYFGF